MPHMSSLRADREQPARLSGSPCRQTGTFNRHEVQPHSSPHTAEPSAMQPSSSLPAPARPAIVAGRSRDTEGVGRHGPRAIGRMRDRRRRCSPARGLAVRERPPADPPRPHLLDRVRAALLTRHSGGRHAPRRGQVRPASTAPPASTADTICMRPSCGARSGTQWRSLASPSGPAAGSGAAGAPRRGHHPDRHARPRSRPGPGPQPGRPDVRPVSLAARIFMADAIYGPRRAAYLCQEAIACGINYDRHEETRVAVPSRSIWHTPPAPAASTRLRSGIRGSATSSWAD